MYNISGYSGVTQLSVETLVEPLRELNLSEEEVLIGAMVTIFCNAALGTSAEGVQAINEASETFTAFLQIVAQEGRNEMMAALRVARISMLFASIVVNSLRC